VNFFHTCTTTFKLDPDSRGETSCQTSGWRSLRSKAIARTRIHTDTRTQWNDCSIWPLKWLVIITHIMDGVRCTFSALTLLVGQQEGHPACKKWEDGGGGHWLVWMEWCPAGWLVCLPLLIFPCTIKSRGRLLLAPAYPDSQGKRAVKRLCVCVSGWCSRACKKFWSVPRRCIDLEQQEKKIMGGNLPTRWWVNFSCWQFDLSASWPASHTHLDPSLLLPNASVPTVKLWTHSKKG